MFGLAILRPFALSKEDLDILNTAFGMVYMEDEKNKNKIIPVFAYKTQEERDNALRKLNDGIDDIKNWVADIIVEEMEGKIDDKRRSNRS